MSPPSDTCPPSAFSAQPTPELPRLTLRFLDLHEAACPACGYNVHRVPEPRCPECGRALRLRLVAEGPTFGVPWLILMVVSSLGAGVGVFVLSILTWERMPSEWYWRVILTYFLCNIPVPVAVFLLRRSLHRLEGLAAWVAPLLMTIATFTMGVWFLANLGRP